MDLDRMASPKTARGNGILKHTLLCGSALALLVSGAPAFAATELRDEKRGRLTDWLGAERAREARVVDLADGRALTATKQFAQAAPTVTYDIPAGPLAAALNRFAEQSGVQLVYSAEVATGLNTAGVSGRFTPEEALRLLLSGSGIVYRFADNKTVTLEREVAQSDDGAETLDPIRIEGNYESPYGPVEGYVANVTTTGTKTGTPLIETPQSISIVTRDRLDDQNAATISEALRYVPGVQGETFGADSRVDFLQYRGFDESGGGVFRDGLGVRSTGFAKSQPELYGAQRVEILRGPASVLYGQGTPGGLVNVVSKTPTRDPFLETQAELGSFDRVEGRFDLGGAVYGTESLSFRLTGLVRESGTQIDKISDDRVFLAPAIKWEAPGSQGETSFTLLGNFQDDRSGATNQFLPASGTVESNPNGTISENEFIGDPDFDEFDRTAFSVGYLFEHQINDSFDFRQNLRYDSVDVDYRSLVGSGLLNDGVPGSDPGESQIVRIPFIEEGDNKQVSVDSQVETNFTAIQADHTLLFGFDYQYYDVEQRRRTFNANDPANFGILLPLATNAFDPVYGVDVPTPPVASHSTTDQHQFGLYSQEQLKVFDDLVVTLGARQDLVLSDNQNQLTGKNDSQTDYNLSLRAGLVYVTEWGAAPYLSYAESFLPVIGSDVDGDAFEPETGELLEIGVKFQPPGWNSFMTVSAFQITRQNVLTPDDANTGFNVQTGEVRSRGVEVEVNTSFDIGLDLTASYTFQDAQVTESNRVNATTGVREKFKRPATVPEHQASLWSFYTLQQGPLAGLGVGAGLRYKGSTYGDNFNSFTVDEYFLVDAALRYTWNDLTVGLNGVNLLDKQHVAACSNANSCFYGVDQAFVGSISYRW